MMTDSSAGVHEDEITPVLRERGDSLEVSVRQSVRHTAAGLKRLVVGLDKGPVAEIDAAAHHAEVRKFQTPTLEQHQRAPCVPSFTPFAE